MTNTSEGNKLIAAIVDARDGHMEHRTCTAEAPMQTADKDRFRWHHLDAVEEGPFFNLVKATCPHCLLTFTCLPRTG